MHNRPTGDLGAGHKFTHFNLIFNLIKSIIFAPYYDLKTNNSEWHYLLTLVVFCYAFFDCTVLCNMSA